MKKVVFIIIYILLAMLVRSQSTIDSLLQELEKADSESVQIDIMNEIADECYFDDASMSAKYTKMAYEQSKTLNYKKGLAHAYKQLAIFQYDSLNYQNAITLFEKSAKLFAEDNNKYQEAKRYFGIGQCYIDLGIYPIALEYHNKCLEIIRQLNKETDIANSLMQIALIQESQGNYVKALDNYFKSLEIIENQNNDEHLADVINNLGGVYFAMNDFEKAKEYYNKAIAIFEKIDNKEGKAECLNNIAMVYKESGEIKKAFSTLNEAVQINKEIGNEVLVGYAYANIGWVHENTKNYTKALEYYNLALKLFSKLDIQSAVCILYNNIGFVYQKSEEYQKAIEYGHKSLEKAKLIGSKDDMLNAYRNLFESYEKSSNYKNALKYHRLYKQLSDSIFNNENTKKLTQIEMQFNFDKIQREKELEQQKKDAIQKAEMMRQKTLLNSFLVGFLLMILLVFFIYKGYRVKKLANIELTKKNETITSQKNEILQSIQYAKKIQYAVLPSETIFQQFLSGHFVLFKPRDIVSGDFYWIRQLNEYIIIATADCTGHGVPGAFMSMLGVSLLNEIVSRNKDVNSGMILNRLREKIKTVLHQDGKEKEQKDGMDMALCVLNTKNRSLQYSGAYNSLFVLRNSKVPLILDNSQKLKTISKNECVLNEVKADRQPVAVFIKEQDFTTNTIQLEKGDTLYTFSDGYVDQIGGKKNKKFMTRNFKNLLLDIYDKPMEQQRNILDDTIEDWKHQNDQIDDILIIGIKIT